MQNKMLLHLLRNQNYNIEQDVVVGQEFVTYPTPRIALSVGWFVRSSVGDKISAKFHRTISRQRKELSEIRWCQNDRIFEGFLEFPKK